MGKKAIFAFENWSNEELDNFDKKQEEAKKKYREKLKKDSKKGNSIKVQDIIKEEETYEH